MMKAVLFYGTKDIRLEDVPLPKIEHPDDAIVKVELAGLCGSDLHVYRGLEGEDGVPFIMGHEIYGEIVSLGSSFSVPPEQARPLGYSTLRVGTKVISTFTVSCLECSNCRTGFTSRCSASLLFGSPKLPGAQAQFVRVPKAGGTLIPINTPSVSEPISSSPSFLPPDLALLLSDILPTGYFAAKQAFFHSNLAPLLDAHTTPQDLGFLSDGLKSQLPSVSYNLHRNVVFGIVGLGPVGICSLVALVDVIHSFLESNPGNVKFFIFCVDLLASRRKAVERILQRMPDDKISPNITVLILSPDIVKHDCCNALLEVVGHPSSLKLCAQMAAPFGVISSVGVHTAENFGIPPSLLYDKNLSLSFGRCPVRSLLPTAKVILERRREWFEGFFEDFVGFESNEKVKDAYDRFESGKIGKIGFRPWAS